jgi:hypothetical protein
MSGGAAQAPCLCASEEKDQDLCVRPRDIVCTEKEGIAGKKA